MPSVLVHPYTQAVPTADRVQMFQIALPSSQHRRLNMLTCGQHRCLDMVICGEGAHVCIGDHQMGLCWSWKGSRRATAELCILRMRHATVGKELHYVGCRMWLGW